MSGVRNTPALERVAGEILKGMASPDFRPPMLPQVAREALRLARNRQASMREMAILIEKDPVLAGRFLSTANSSAYNRGVPVTSVNSALARLGIETTRDVLVFASLEPFFVVSKELEPTLLALRRHSLVCSAAANMLARLAKIPGGDAGLCGLIHDIGALSLLRYIGDHMLSFPELLSSQGYLGLVLMQLHEAAGASVSRSWSLPDAVHAVISSHHSAGRSGPTLVRLTAAADELATRCGAGTGWELTDKQLPETLVGPTLVKQALADLKDRLDDLSAG